MKLWYKDGKKKKKKSLKTWSLNLYKYFVHIFYNTKQIIDI